MMGNITKGSQNKSIKYICEKIWHLEDKYNLLSFEIDGVKIWQYLRMIIYYQIAEKSGVINNPHPHKRSSKIFSRFKAIFYAFNNIILNNPLLGVSQVDVIIFPHERLNEIEGKYCDIYTKYLIEDFKDNKVNYLALIRPCAGQYTVKTSAKTKYLDILKLYSIVAPYCRAGIKKRDCNIFVTKLTQEIKETFNCDLDLNKLFIKGIKRFKAEYNFYKLLFSLRKPKQIYLVNGYYLHAAMIKVAKDLDIESIELQHGTLSYYHLGYSYPGLDHELDYFPDKFYSWGQYWSDLIKYPIKRENVVDYKYQYFRELKKANYHIVKKSNQIIVVSQGAIGEQLAKLILKKIDYIKEFIVIYKLHPSEVLEENVYLLELGRYKSVRIIKDGDLYKLLAESNYIIGVFSTALYEGIGFGCKPIIADLCGIEYMSKIIDQYAIPVLTEETDLKHMLKNYGDLNIDVKAFF
jgi:hypothetical protein